MSHDFSATPESSIRIAIATDLHYVCDKTGNSVRYKPQTAQGQAHDLMVKLIEFIHQKSLTADWVLCPGDITNQANHQAFKEGWENLKKLKNALQAQRLVAATGNHEIDSRVQDDSDEAEKFETTIDPVGLLQSIDDYPASFDGDATKRWIYWGRGYEIIETDDTILVVINSCHFHVTMQPCEYTRGKISEVALCELNTAISSLAQTKKFRVVLLHHHPIQHQDLEAELGRIDMYNGAKLVELLEKTFLDWVIIHGHKHHPRLITAQGAAAPPFVFAAGTFGAALNGMLATKTKNQFYLLTLEAHLDHVDKYQFKGRVEAYYWSGSEWREATEREHGLPTGCGFARNQQVSDLATKAHQYISNQCETSETYVRWDEMCTVMPALKYLMPGQIEMFKECLARLGVKTGSNQYLWFPQEFSL